MLRKLGFLFILFVMANTAMASHIAGADVSYECLGGDSFRIRVKVWNDCSGITFSINNPYDSVYAYSTCGGVASAPLTLEPAPPGQGFGLNGAGVNVSQLCPADSCCSACFGAGSTCFPACGGNFTGMVEYTLTGVIHLNPACDFWTVGYYVVPARNPVQNLNGNSTYAFARIYNGTVPCNNSPELTTPNPIPYVCLNTPVCYDFDFVEQDGDSLVFTLDTALSFAGVGNPTPATYNPGFSPTAPIQGITINPQTGLISFTPTTTGNFVVAVRIYEYRNGQLIGMTVREFQFVVENCTNIPPDLCGQQAAITNFTGTGALIDSNTVEVCYGQNFSFDVIITDPNPLDSLTATSNVDSILPGAVMTQTGSNPLTVNISWLANANSNPKNTFNLVVRDNSCPVPALSSATYNVNVVPSTSAGPDITICRGVEQANIQAIGGNVFGWTVLSGDPIVVGTNFSCDSCANPVATPNNTTTYQVVSDLSSSCKNIDTITVFVADNYTLDVRTDTIICFNDSNVEIYANPSITAGFFYQWDNGSKLNFDTIRNPIATPFTSTTFNVTVESDSGCVKTAQSTVRVTPPFPREIYATSNDTVSCAGQPLQLGVQLGKVINSCSTTNDICEGREQYVTVGTGNNFNTATGANAWPAPYGNSQRSSRHQFLIRASELNALGIFKGTIYSLAFELEDNPGLNSYDNFSIKMKCTSDSILNTWQSGMQTVFTPKTVNVPNSGWNEHILDQAYDYDGVSNLVVEVCFFRPLFPSQNAQTRYSTTSFNSTIYNFSFTSSTCNSNSVTGTSNNRPNMRFSFCAGPSPTGFEYQWLPATGLSADNIIDPLASITDSITYTVYIQDTSGSCFDTSSIKLQLSVLEISDDTTVCPSTDVSLFAQAETSCPGQNPSYQWTPATALDNDTIANPTANVDTTTTFYVTYSDPCGCVITDSVTIFIKTLPEPTLISTPPTCGLANGVLTVDENGGVAPFQYSLDSGQTYFASPTFTNLNNGYYEVLIKDAEGCYGTLRDTFGNTAPIIDSILFADLTCFEGRNGQIEIFTSGGIQPISYSLDSGRTFTQASTSLTLEQGVYHVQVMSADSCISVPESIVLNQPDRLEVNYQIQEISCFQACDGAFSAQAYGGTQPYNYNWVGQVADSTVNSLCAGSYQLQVTDTNNCLYDSTFVLIEPDELIIDTVRVNPITCNGFNNGRIEIVANGGTGGIFYSIDSGANFFTSPIFDSLAPGTYPLRVEDANGCFFAEPFAIVEPDPMVLQTNIDTTIICVSTCQTIDASITGGNGGYRFFWNPTQGNVQSINVCPAETENISLYVTDTFGCISNTKFLQVNLYDSLSLETNQEVTICDAFIADLEAYAAGGEGTNYSFHWTPYPGLDNPLRQFPKASPDTTTLYTVELTDDCGSPAVTATVLVEVNKMPELMVTSDITQGCTPARITFQNSGTQNAVCTWNFGETDRFFQSCNTMTYTYREPGEYGVRFYIETAEGCLDSVVLRDYVTVFRSPRANFSMEPEQASAFNPEVEFEDLSEGDVVSWHWQFGTLGNSTAQDTSWEFPTQDTATYPIKLTVTNFDGCEDDTIKYIFVDTEYYLFVPTAFTPNGDGLNDLFVPISNGVQPDNYIFSIYDRWGKLVFETQNINEGWNGKYMNEGDLMPAAQYVWRVKLGEFAGEENESESRMGNLNLLR